MNVALLHHSYWPEVRRGSERFARDLADGLLASGHRVTLITSHAARPTRSVEDGLVVLRGWRPHDAWLRRRGVAPHLTHLPFSYAALRTGRFDVAHALHPADGLASARWARTTGRPAILSIMGIADRAAVAGTPGVARNARRAAAGSGAVVALSRAAADSLERVLGIRAEVIAPGVALERFTPGGARAPAPTILCPAALADPRKRAGLLLDAFALVRAQLPDARLLVSAPAPPEVRAAAGVQELAIDELPALVDAYRSAWVTALASQQEAFGLVLAESLACSSPVVACRSGAIEELVDRPGIGALSENSPESLARALLDGLALSQRPATAASCRARAEELSSDRTAGAYERLYHRVADRGHDARR